MEAIDNYKELGKLALIPEEIVRDQIGCWSHSVVDKIIEGVDESWTRAQFEELFAKHGLKTTSVSMDGDVDMDEYDRMNEMANYSEWNPTSPGSEYVLVSVYDTEDGPYAQFIAPLLE